MDDHSCQYTKIEEMMAIQRASQLQFESLQTVVQQHFLRPFNVRRQDSAASFSSVASFATRNADNPWKDLCRGLHKRGVRIRPESLTDNLVAQLAAILQVEGAYSSCESTGKIKKQTHNPTKIDP